MDAAVEGDNSVKGSITAIHGNIVEVGFDRGLPDINDALAGAITDDDSLFVIGVSIYRGFVESVRSENRYRLKSMEGASENITRRISDLDSLHNYVRQEEITGEMLEILDSGGFYGR